MISPAGVAALVRLALRAPSEAAAIASELMPASKRDVRNALIQHVLARFYPGAPKVAACKFLAVDLQIGTALGAAQRAEFVVAINALNNGSPLGWRQIVNVADGVCGPSNAARLQSEAPSLQFDCGRPRRGSRIRS
jgi:hypothetical protein